MKEILSNITYALRRRFDAMLDDNAKVDVVEFLFFIQNDIRLNQLATPTQVEELWAMIREKEALVDFVHGGSQQMRFILGADGWAEMLEKLADAYTIHYESSLLVSEEEAIDEDLMERMVSKPNLTDYMKQYPWLVLILLIDFLELDRVLGDHRPEGD
jgi:hypothetical protein